MWDVTFDVNGELHVLPEQQATALTTRLRLSHGTEHDPGAALQVANEIEDTLVGRRDDPIQLADERAEAVYQALNFMLAFQSEPPAESMALLRATRPPWALGKQADHPPPSSP